MYISYVAEPAATPRPVIFAFNGGPGSSSVWVHFGLGPRRVADIDLLQPRTAPPFAIEDNPDSLLDVADLVFIDPPGTGFSRVLDEDKLSEFYSVTGDAAATLRFVSAWSRRHRRENAPKFLLGESYGAIRAAAMANLATGGPTQTGRIESLAFNGVMLLGANLDLHQQAELEWVNVLPSLAATAWYHDRVPDRPSDLGEHVDAARRFAATEYLTALYEGTALEPARRDAVVARLHQLTGLDPAFIVEHDLRISTTIFADSLLGDQNRQTGMYDSRYVLSKAGRTMDPVADDPAMGQYVPSFAGVVGPYLRDELGADRDEPYHVIDFGRVNSRWDWGDGPGRLRAANYAHDLAAVMRRNADFELFAASGWFDLVTPAGSLRYSVSRAPLDPKRTHFGTYESGHMPYLGREPRALLVQELREFVLRVSGKA
ncbi:S10 family peptidase [Amycolatopsis sp. NPDC098790]|uniref:S10 family peptidase n=1 Tax=Amycolatopsis sp. NPDC098790 TaxID=3363939 RepID=UPI0037F2ED64